MKVINLKFETMVNFILLLVVRPRLVELVRLEVGVVRIVVFGRNLFRYHLVIGRRECSSSRLVTLVTSLVTTLATWVITLVVRLRIAWLVSPWIPSIG